VAGPILGGLIAAFLYKAYAGMKHILALDQGTTSSRTICSTKGSVVASARRSPPDFSSPAGGTRCDRDLGHAVVTATEALGKAGLTAADIAAVG